MTGGCSARAPL